jgi:hypothetical protein
VEVISKHTGIACFGDEHKWARGRAGGSPCRCGALILCAQCWRGKPRSLFVRRDGATGKNCSDCKSLYHGSYGERGSEPRRGLRVISDAAPRVRFVASSKNGKLGGIGAATISPETCPPSCGFYGRGCFAEFGPLGHHWRQTADVGMTWDAFLQAVRAQPAEALWRYAVAGDLPGQGDTLDHALLGELVRANEGKRGFAFTHKPLTGADDQEAVRWANTNGFSVNLSADTLAQADARAELLCGPVVVVLPEDAPARLMTPGGRHVVVCPAETHAALDCARCGLCAIRSRKVVIGFRAHGQMKNTVSGIAGGTT